jgi:hypothetical protein
LQTLTITDGKKGVGQVARVAFYWKTEVIWCGLPFSLAQGASGNSIAFAGYGDKRACEASGIAFYWESQIILVVLPSLRYQSRDRGTSFFGHDDAAAAQRVNVFRRCSILKLSTVARFGQPQPAGV